MVEAHNGWQHFEPFSLGWILSVLGRVKDLDIELIIVTQLGKTFNSTNT